MPRLFFILLIIALALPASSAAAQEVPELQINSKRYVVIDAETGHVYAQKNAHQEAGIASLTKIFTAVQALEMATPDTLITTNQSDMFGSSATVMGFGPGETYTLTDMIYGMLLPSGNDAAHAIARNLGMQPGFSDEEAVEHFMSLLNQRVLDMGLTNTHLVTPSGWGVPGHYSSAWDVAAMMQHALGYPLIVDAISTIDYTTSNGALTVNNTNKLLNSYGALIGGKTGYDNDAGWCLVEVAKRGERRMISVTLDGIAPDDWYDDNRVLLEYGFDQETSGRSASWSGDVVRWQNPSIARVSRSAEPDVSLVGKVMDVPEHRDLADATSPEPAVDPIAAGSVLGTVAVLAILITLRGTIAFRRWPLGRHHAIDSEPDPL